MTHYCATVTSVTTVISFCLHPDSTATLFHTDIPQCDSENGGCSQICIEQIPGFDCACENGYILDENGTTCNGTIYCCNSISCPGYLIVFVY